MITSNICSTATCPTKRPGVTKRVYDFSRVPKTGLSQILKLLQNSDLETASVGENAKDSLSLDLLVADHNCCCRCCWRPFQRRNQFVGNSRGIFSSQWQSPITNLAGEKIYRFLLQHLSPIDVWAKKKQRLKRTLVVFGSGHIPLKVPNIEFRLQCMGSHVKT